MIKALKILGLFISFIFFLSITVEEKPLFGHLYEAISPVTTSAQNYISRLFGKSVLGTQDFSRKLFDNSVPKVSRKLTSKFSQESKSLSGEPAEKITDDEKVELESLIKNHR